MVQEQDITYDLYPHFYLCIFGSSAIEAAIRPRQHTKFTKILFINPFRVGILHSEMCGALTDGQEYIHASLHHLVRN